MAQPTLVSGIITYTLPYPQEYGEPSFLRAADTVTLNGYVHRDFVQGAAYYYRKPRLTYEALTTAEIQTVKGVWRALRAGAANWTYTNPRGTVFTVRLDMADPNLKVRMSPGGDGSIEYSVTLNLVEV
jgi:hypothetical protein